MMVSLLCLDDEGVGKDLFVCLFLFIGGWMVIYCVELWIELFVIVVLDVLI